MAAAMDSLAHRAKMGLGAPDAEAKTNSHDCPDCGLALFGRKAHDQEVLVRTFEVMISKSNPHY
jgi:hypothetical protein